MNIPFTIEQFLGVFEKYNIAVWPMQILLVVLAILTPQAKLFVMLAVRSGVEERNTPEKNFQLAYAFEKS